MLLFDRGHFEGFPELLVQTKTPIALFQILIRILQAQQTDSGSWGSCEETAYAILALKSLSSLPFVSIMLPTIQDAVTLGRGFLLAHLDEEQETKDKTCLWIDKINYRIPHVSYSYVLTALHSTTSPLSGYPSSLVGELDQCIVIPVENCRYFQRFYRKMPMFQDLKEWQLLAYVAEGYLYNPILVDVSKSLFGREGVGKAPYMEYIAATWTIANGMLKRYSSPQNCFACMTISIINVRCANPLSLFISGINILAVSSR